MCSITACTTSGTVEQVNADFSVSHVPAAAAAPLTHAPSWLKRPASCTWGFGGKLAALTNAARQLPTGEVVQTGQIAVQQVVTEGELVARSEAFERSIRPSPEAAVDRGLLKDLCATKAAAAGGAERETWQLMGILFEEEARRQLLLHLGFEDALPAPEPETQPPEAELPGAGVVDLVGPPAPAQPPLPQGDGTDFFDQDGGFDFDQPPPPPATPEVAAESLPMAPVVAGEGEAAIERALTVGNYDGAVDECIKVRWFVFEGVVCFGESVCCIQGTCDVCVVSYCGISYGGVFAVHIRCHRSRVRVVSLRGGWSQAASPAP